MNGPFRIAIASGKGGTGKTTLATGLATVLAESGVPTAYVDCDVEEPNGRLFLRPRIEAVRGVSVPVPEVDPSRCTRCGACERACRFSAISVLSTTVLTFPTLCHGCGACALACRRGAIREVPRVIGAVASGAAGSLRFVEGRIEIGEAIAPPVIRATLDAVPVGCTAVIDAPPGTSCPVIESVKDADVVLLVTEPTPFGVNDLGLAVEMVRELGVPHAVAVNRAMRGDDPAAAFCARERIPVLLTIPNELKIARAYSRGELAVRASPELTPRLLSTFEALRALARRGRSERPRRSGAGTSRAASPAVAPPAAVVHLGPAPDVPELVVVSGKGGTGKTSVTASFAALAGDAAVADCDVDAADLHLVLEPTVLRRSAFSGGSVAVIDPARCTGCGVCAAHCRFDAIVIPRRGAFSCEIDEVSCEGCGVCVTLCPQRAIRLEPSGDGEWFVSATRHGPLVHARLGVARENGGKLVSLVRREGKAVARAEGRALVICDGSPGIGCPVIASVTGARMALIVTEPTISGLHDFERIAGLCRLLHADTAVCVNKADVNAEIAARIEAEAAQRGIPVLGRIRYDEAVTVAQTRRRAVVEDGDGPAAADLRALWDRVRQRLGALGRARPPDPAPASRSRSEPRRLLP